MIFGRLIRFAAALSVVALASPAARAADDRTPDRPQPRVLIVAAEDEYRARETMPDLADTLRQRGLRVTVLAPDDKNDLDGLDALADADLLIMFMRRCELPPEQLRRFQDYFQAGRPLVALRTSSHAFQNWLEFDKLVLGCNYAGHYGNSEGTEVSVAREAAEHPILDDLDSLEFHSAGSLYKSKPLAESATPLLIGSIPGQDPEPVAWTNTHQEGRVFYTSLGHPDDFQKPAFVQLLINAVFWSLDRQSGGP